MLRYEVLAHTADTGIIAHGATMRELFEHAGFGMFDLMFDLGSLRPQRDYPIAAAGDTVEDLLVAWLEELLFVAERDGLALCTFAVGRLGGGRVEGVAGGRNLEGVELRGPPVKAVTWHDLAVGETADGLWARVIFDV